MKRVGVEEMLQAVLRAGDRIGDEQERYFFTLLRRVEGDKSLSKLQSKKLARVYQDLEERGLLKG